MATTQKPSSLRQGNRTFLTSRRRRPSSKTFRPCTAPGSVSSITAPQSSARSEAYSSTGAFAFAKSITRARRTIPVLLSDMTNGLTAMARETISELWDLMCDLDRRVALFDKKIDAAFRADLACQRIAQIKGVGPKTATAMVAVVGDAAEFKNGRHLAAWLGLVPPQHSSGDRQVIMGISKRGSQHLRSLLVHGARAVVRTAPNKHDRHNQSVNDLRERRGFNRAPVAVANKTARIIWAVLRTSEPYRAAA
jgi:transposase